MLKRGQVLLYAISAVDLFFCRDRVYEKSEYERGNLAGYSALDDQTMFYKAWLKGMKTVVVPDAQYNHLDARTSSRNNKPAMIYSLSYNRIVFWHRFIFCMQSNALLKCWAAICFNYRQIMEWGFDFISVARRKLSKNDWKMSRKGSRDGWKYIKSNEYLKIPDLNEMIKEGRGKNE